MKNGAINIIGFTDTDVDRCGNGNYITGYIFLEGGSIIYNAEQKDKIMNLVREVRNELGDDSDTEEIIRETLIRFFGNDVKYKIVIPFCELVF